MKIFNVKQTRYKMELTCLSSSTWLRMVWIPDPRIKVNLTKRVELFSYRHLKNVEAMKQGGPKERTAKTKQNKTNKTWICLASTYYPVPTSIVSHPNRILGLMQSLLPQLCESESLCNPMEYTVHEILQG